MGVDLQCGILNLWPGDLRLKVKASRPRLGVLWRSKLADIDILPFVIEEIGNTKFLVLAAGICVLAVHIRKGRQSTRYHSCTCCKRSG